MRFRLVPLVLAAATLVACGEDAPDDNSRTDDLRDSLQTHYGDDRSYDGLGQVTLADGVVTVDTEAWADVAYGAYLYCSWIENALRNDLGDPQLDIVVVMDGDEILRASDGTTCEEAEPQV